MKKPKLTPWFPGDVKPARKGVYQREATNLGGDYFAFWNGRWWGAYQPSTKGAYEARKCESMYVNLPWRGLTSKAAA